MVKKGKGGIKEQKAFILEDLRNILNDIEKTSAGTASEDDFKGMFDDMDLTSTKLGSRESEKILAIKNVKWIVSYDNNKEIKKLYLGSRKKEYSFLHIAYEIRVRKEILFSSKSLAMPRVAQPTRI